MLRINKKAQIIGQVFIYLFAAIIFVLVLMYGYRIIGKFMEQRDYVATIEMKTEIKQVVMGIGPSQSMKKMGLTMPSKVNKVCFIDLTKRYPNHLSVREKTIVTNNYQMIGSFWEDNITKNVFFDPPINLFLNVGKIALEDDSGVSRTILCFNVTNDKLYLQLTGQGDKTKITQWVPY